MTQDTTNGGNANSRRQFLQQTAAVTRAVLIGGSALSTIAAGPSATLQDGEIAVALELLTDNGHPYKSGMVLVLAEHFAALATSGNTRALDEMRERIARRAVDVAALRSETRAMLTDCVQALANGE